MFSPPLSTNLYRAFLIWFARNHSKLKHVWLHVFELMRSKFLLSHPCKNRPFLCSNSSLRMSEECTIAPLLCTLCVPSFSNSLVSPLSFVRLVHQNFITLIKSAPLVVSAPMAFKASTPLITYFFPPASICRFPTSARHPTISSPSGPPSSPDLCSSIPQWRHKSSSRFVLLNQQRDYKCQQRSCGSLCPFVVELHYSLSWHPSSTHSIFLATFTKRSSSPG